MARAGLEPEANPEGERGPRFEPGEPGWRDPDSKPEANPEGERGHRFGPGEPGWRDPDSNRGHHDFQTFPRNPQTRRKTPQTRRVPEQPRMRGSPQIPFFPWGFRR